MNNTVSRKGAKWNHDEDEHLHNLLLQGKSIHEMSIIHQRTETAIRFRLTRYALQAIENGRDIKEVSMFYNISILTLQEELKKNKFQTKEYYNKQSRNIESSHNKTQVSSQVHNSYNDRNNVSAGNLIGELFDRFVNYLEEK